MKTLYIWGFDRDRIRQDVGMSAKQNFFFNLIIEKYVSDALIHWCQFMSSFLSQNSYSIWFSSAILYCCVYTYMWSWALHHSYYLKSSHNISYHMRPNVMVVQNNKQCKKWWILSNILRKWEYTVPINASEVISMYSQFRKLRWSHRF